MGNPHGVLFVEAHEGFVEDDDPCSLCQDLSQRSPSQHAPAELARHLVTVRIGEPHLAERIQSRILFNRQSGRAQGQGDVFLHVEGVDQHALLKNHADGTLFRVSLLGGDLDKGPGQGRDTHQMQGYGRLSRTGHPLKPEALAFTEFELNTLVLKGAIVSRPFNGHIKQHLRVSFPLRIA